jgi:hypothetical protein
MAEIRTPTSPGYNAPIAERLRRETGMVVRTLGMITTAKQAEATADVGLGKTLEGGLVAAELVLRKRADRILVVTTKAMLTRFQKEI